MNTAEWLAVASVLGGLLAGLAMVRWLAARWGASPEVARKSVHVAMGLACAGFPWVFARPLPVWVLAAAATLPLAAIRLLPRLRHGVGSALHGIARPSFGEVLFAPAVAAVFALARGDRELYLIPILILTLADAAGALVGTRWGKRRYGAGEGFKTVEGSLIFMAMAFLCGFLPLWLGGRVDAMHALWVGLILAVLAMMVEGISDRGFDNLVIPVGCFFLLEKLLPLAIPALAGRFGVLAALLSVVLAGARWSTLNGGALLGGALLGYGCAVMADWRFALPPVAVFVCHVAITRKHGLTGKFDHRLDAVLSHAMGCLPWVIAASAGGISAERALAGVAFAMGAQLSILDDTTRAALPGMPVTPLRSPAKGFLVAALPGLVWLAGEWRALAGPVVAAWLATVAATAVFHGLRPRYRGHITGLWMIQGGLSLAVSLVAWMIPA